MKTEVEKLLLTKSDEQAIMTKLNKETKTKIY